MILSFWSVFSLLALAYAGEPGGLNFSNFAACLHKNHGEAKVTHRKSEYSFGAADGLFFYLFPASGQGVGMANKIDRGLNKLGALLGNSKVRQPTQSLVLAPLEHWSGYGTTSEGGPNQWAIREANLADFLVQRQSRNSAHLLSPGELFSQAQTVCEPNAEPFCAALVCHNVLRTLGRAETAVRAGVDYNPPWYIKLRTRPDWKIERERIRKGLLPLRRDGGGDGWGEWYHVFGVMTFVLHERAIGQPDEKTERIVATNQLANKTLTGHEEDPVKAQIDRDSAKMTEAFLDYPQAQAQISCDLPAAYVAPTNRETTANVGHPGPVSDEDTFAGKESR